MAVDFSLVADTTFTTIDGRELRVGDYFEDNDFVADREKPDNIFVRHAALLRVAKKVFDLKSYEVMINNEPKVDNFWAVQVKVDYNFFLKEKDKPVKPVKEGSKEESYNDYYQNQYHWSAVADCNTKNAPKGFEQYTVALAETRASARALRNILGVEFCSKEEISGETIVISDSLKIRDDQKVLLEMKFMKDLNMTLDDFSEIVGRKISNVRDLNRAEATTIIKKVNSKKG